MCRNRQLDWIGVAELEAVEENTIEGVIFCAVILLSTFHRSECVLYHLKSSLAIRIYLKVKFFADGCWCKMDGQAHL